MIANMATIFRLFKFHLLILLPYHMSDLIMINLGAWAKVFRIRVRILARILAKCELKKQFARWYFLYLHFLASGNLGLLSVVLNLEINLLSSFLKCSSLKVNVFVFIHRKTLPMAEVYIGYNLNAQTHTINSPAWSGLSQSNAF